MDVSMMRRLKELEDENARLKKMYADERIKAEIAREALTKKVGRATRLKDVAQEGVKERSISIRLACEAVGISETCYRYISKLNDENKVIADWLLKITTNNPNWGFGLCYLYLRNVKLFIWNHKRIY
jgi:putative transposase